jgi:hypothetical protein
MQCSVASDQEPIDWPKTLHHGQRFKQSLSFDGLPNLTGWQVRAAIADIEGIDRVVEATVTITGTKAAIEFSLDQIKSVPPGQYLADCTVLSPLGDPWVLLKGVWTIKAGAVY